MTDLSPAGQAVLDATYNTYSPADSLALRRCVAAALRALDSQLGHEVLGVRYVDCSQIQLVAAELEGAGAA